MTAKCCIREEQVLYPLSLSLSSRRGRNVNRFRSSSRVIGDVRYADSAVRRVPERCDSSSGASSSGGKSRARDTTSASLIDGNRTESKGEGEPRVLKVLRRRAVGARACEIGMSYLSSRGRARNRPAAELYPYERARSRRDLRRRARSRKSSLFFLFAPRAEK